MGSKEFWTKMMHLDRKIIYVLIALSVIIPLLFPFGTKSHVTPPTKRIYDEVEKIASHEQGRKGVLMLSFDYDPSTLPELQPMTWAMIRHAFSRNVKVVGLTLFPEGAGLVKAAFDSLSREYNKREGIDFVNLGYKPGISAVIMSMGESIEKTFLQDYNNTPIREIPMMKNIRNYNDVDLIVTFSGTGTVVSWITYAHGRYHINIATGVTAVMASDYYPFLQTGQFIGMLGGLKGAAEYEKLLLESKNAMVNPELVDFKPTAQIGMDAQNISHLVILVFIIIGNLAYFLSGQARRK